MVYTFANRTVALVGVFETPIEIMEAIIRSLGGNIIPVSLTYNNDVYVIGSKTKQNTFNYFDKFCAGNPNISVLVYEGKFDDYVLDGLCLGERIEFFKQQFPWYE